MCCIIHVLCSLHTGPMVLSYLLFLSLFAGLPSSCVSNVNDDEFFRNLSTIGKSGVGQDSDSEDLSPDEVLVDLPIVVIWFWFCLLGCSTATLCACQIFSSPFKLARKVGTVTYRSRSVHEHTNHPYLSWRLLISGGVPPDNLLKSSLMLPILNDQFDLLVVKLKFQFAFQSIKNWQ